MEIDLSKARATVRELSAALEALDGTAVDETPTRAGRAQRTEVSRTLQRLAHLGDRASVEIMDAYYVFKERDEPGGKDLG
ncbi:hypothetical protein GCM10022403_083710 [Streptomyces coacervatus]|uniref:Uncharacterized protein n=1 Tax=Streptomyces coacervatus TaxID=647381 RepID=A0ABP7JAQ3_9ACTN|nr:hypothetical protein [Streptomyces coacervatus]MDF2270275.1 hypothetical protein [Streptomyces coacervatus]